MTDRCTITHGACRGFSNSRFFLYALARAHTRRPLLVPAANDTWARDLVRGPT